MKEIRDYLRKNGVYIRKEAKKLIIDNLLKIIYKLTPLKWPTDNFADKPINNSTSNSIDDSTSNPTNNSADNPTDDFTNDPTNNSTLALLLLLTAPVQIT